MEQAEQVGVAVDGTGRASERYGWVTLSASVLLGIFAAVITAIPPEYVLSSPFFQSAYPIMGALSIASVGFNIFAVVMVLVPYRRHERWAWYTLWLLPLMWISHFLLAPDRLYYLVLAIITTIGLILPYRRFFSGPEDEDLV